MQLGQVGTGLFGSAHVRVAHHLHERHSRSVHIDQAVGIVISAVNVLKFGHVLFQVHPFHTHGTVLTIGGDFQSAVHSQRHIVLGYLITLHQVGVGVVLAVELCQTGNLAAQGQAHHDGVFHGLFVYHRQRARQSQAHRANSAVHGRIVIIGPARAKHLALGLELDVDLKSDDCFVFH